MPLEAPKCYPVKRSVPEQSPHAVWLSTLFCPCMIRKEVSLAGCNQEMKLGWMSRYWVAPYKKSWHRYLSIRWRANKLRTDQIWGSRSLSTYFADRESGEMRYLKYIAPTNPSIHISVLPLNLSTFFSTAWSTAFVRR